MPVAISSETLQQSYTETLQSMQATRRRQEGVTNWLGLTVAAINTGGLVTAVSVYDKLRFPKTVIAIFLAGVILTWLTAFFFASAFAVQAERAGELLKILKMKPLEIDAEAYRKACDDYERSKKFFRPVIAFGVLALSIMFVGPMITALTIRDDGGANDARCYAIQMDLLSARPRMAAPADAFQALGCKPQGSDRRIFVPPTDREKVAKHALPDGGYPPPM